jgi:hypothetical protein
MYGVIIDYTIFRASTPSSMRTGTIRGAWNGSSVVFDETTTSDIGNTSQISLNLTTTLFRATNTQGFDIYIVFNIKQLGIILT